VNQLGLRKGGCPGGSEGLVEMPVEENRAVAETERKMGQGGRESNGRDL
jgi:hypothetical protein